MNDELTRIRKKDGRNEGSGSYEGEKQASKECVLFFFSLWEFEPD